MRLFVIASLGWELNGEAISPEYLTRMSPVFRLWARVMRLCVIANSAEMDIKHTPDHQRYVATRAFKSIREAALTSSRSFLVKTCEPNRYNLRPRKSIYKRRLHSFLAIHSQTSYFDDMATSTISSASQKELENIAKLFQLSDDHLVQLTKGFVEAYRQGLQALKQPVVMG